MNFNQIFSVVFVNCKDTSLDFFINGLGFKLYEEITIEGKMCSVLQVNSGDFLMILEKENADPDTFILKTDDCVRDYYFFKKKNIIALTKPRYVDNGLELCFSDPSGNQFIMLEERDYTEA